jgi:TP53 regulating kinase-like protein
VPKVFQIHLDHGILIMEYIENSLSARDYINAIVRGISDKSKVSAKLEELASEIGRYIGILHRSEIIHGDLTTSNILIKKANNEVDELEIERSNLNIYLIDFGLSSISNQLEDKAVDLYVLERALISTHSNNAQEIFEKILQSYCKEYGRHNEKVIGKFEQVRLRGRKRTMIG